MKAAALFCVALGGLSAAAGIAFAVAAFAPIPFADSIDFLGQFFSAGGWPGYGFDEFYARHNEHRLVVPRLWFLADLALFQGTQAFLIAVTVVSALAHAVLLLLVFRSLGHRGWVLWAFAGAALGAMLSPAQWENLVWGFQVQFIQVWLFASLAFLAVARAEGREWAAMALAVVAGLLSTYSMANGLLVWPLLVVLALWSRVRAGPLAVLILAAAAVLGVEVAGFHAHPGHGDPAQTIGQPVLLLRYAFRYLANGVGAIGTLGQELVGGLLFAMVAAMTVHAILRPRLYGPGHAVLLAIAGFVIGAALLTALGRVTFGLGQANAARYATPSFIFLLACVGLLLDRLVRLPTASGRTVGTVAAGGLLLIPGLVDGALHVPAAIGDRDARINAVATYLSGGYRPESLSPIFPFVPRRPFIVLKQMEAEGWGPFADRTEFLPPPQLLAASIPPPSEACRGHIDSVENDPVAGVVVSGWAAAAASAEQPDWIVVTGADGAPVAWGPSRIRRDDVGRAIGTGWRGRGFRASGHHPATAPFAVIGAFADGRLCRVAEGLNPPAPLFVAELPQTALPATGGAWTVVRAADAARTGEGPVPEAVAPAIGTLGEDSALVARIDLPAPPGPALLAVPVRTGAFPMAVSLLVRDATTREVIDVHEFGRPTPGEWTWRIFAATQEPAYRGHPVRIRVTSAGPRPWHGVAVGRPYWIPIGTGG